MRFDKRNSFISDIFSNFCFVVVASDGKWGGDGGCKKLQTMLLLLHIILYGFDVN